MKEKRPVGEFSCVGRQILDNHIQRDVYLILSSPDVKIQISFLEAGMFSQTAEYALRAMVYLASQQGMPRTTQEIAKATQVKIAYLSKVMQSLGRQGLVQSQRGLHGGFTMARPADELTILDILMAVDPIQRIKTCPLGIKGHINLCPLHRRLDHAMKLVEDALRKSTLAELLTEPERARGIPIPLCSWPEDE